MSDSYIQAVEKNIDAAGERTDEITRLREENARLREALEPIVKIKAFTCIYEWTPVEALRDDEEVRVKLTGAQIKKMREAAIREGGK